MCQPDYSFATDIWSVGCILGELMLNFIENRNACNSNGTSKIAENSQHPKQSLFEKAICNEVQLNKVREMQQSIEQTYIFPGASCYPISPCQMQLAVNKRIKGGLYVSNQDQLLKILRLVGAPNDSDQRQGNLDFLDEDIKKKYVKQLAQAYHCTDDIDTRFCKSSPELRDLLREFLVFDPTKRKSAKELLRLSIFDKIRNPSEQILARCQPSLSTDHPDFPKNLKNLHDIVLKEAKKVRKSSKK